jgi:hypothetical protein
MPMTGNVDNEVQDGVAYVSVFVGILRDISKQETVEYMLAMIDDMLIGIAPPS